MSCIAETLSSNMNEFDKQKQKRHITEKNIHKLYKKLHQQTFVRFFQTKLRKPSPNTNQGH